MGWGEWLTQHWHLAGLGAAAGFFLGVFLAWWREL